MVPVELGLPIWDHGSHTYIERVVHKFRKVNVEAKSSTNYVWK